MASIEELKRQKKLSDGDMDEVIERATRLQERAGTREGGTVDDVKAVARELDIDPKFVEAAVAELQKERAAAEATAAEEKQSSAKRKKIGIIAAAVVGGILLLSGLSAAGSIKSAQKNAALAESNLQTVLSRQASLVPQLVALSGGQLGGLGPLEQRLRDARDMKARLEAAEALRLAMATEIGKLPPARDPASSQQRLSLQHEIVGSQNRVTVEQRRYEEALATWRSAQGGFGGKIATALGLAPRAP